MLMVRAEGANARFTDSVHALGAIARKYSDTSLSVSGHSLGGQLANHVLHHASDATAARISTVTTFNKAATPMPTWFKFKPSRASKQTNVKQAGDVVSEAAEPDDSHTIVLINFTGGGLAAHKLESFARSDKTSATVTRKSVEKNLTKEGLVVGTLGAESNPYSAAANVVADVAVAEGVPGASYVQSGLTASSFVGLATTTVEGVLAAATLPEAAAAAAVPLAVAGGIGAVQYGLEEIDETLFGSSSTSAPVTPTFNTVSRGHLPPKPSPQNACQSGARRLAGGACAADPTDDWIMDEEDADEDVGPPVDEAPFMTDEHALPPCVFDEHYSHHPAHEFGSVAGMNALAIAPQLGFFVYDASQDFHGQAVVV
jgi:hypothetical protein